MDYDGTSEYLDLSKRGNREELLLPKGVKMKIGEDGSIFSWCWIHTDTPEIPKDGQT